MNSNKLPALNMLTAKVRDILPNLFTKKEELAESPIGGEIDELGRWMKKERFMNFTGMTVAVPPGMSVYMLAHIDVLEHVYDVLQDFVDGVLIPIDKALSAISHEPAKLSFPGGWRARDVKFPLSHIDPNDLIKKLAACYGGDQLDMRSIERVYRSTGDIEAAAERINVLRSKLGQDERTKVNRAIESITASSEVILEAKIHPAVAKELSGLLETASTWISLYGLFMKQVQDVSGSVGLTIERLNALRQGKK